MLDFVLTPLAVAVAVAVASVRLQHYIATLTGSQARTEPARRLPDSRQITVASTAPSTSFVANETVPPPSLILSFAFFVCSLVV